MQNKSLYSKVLLIVCILSVAISGVALLSTNAKASPTVDYVNVRVPVACSMAVNSSGSEPHFASIENGIYREDIGITAINAFCNDKEGLSIYAVGFTDEEHGKNVLASTSLGETQDIVTGTATSGPTSNWAMKLDADATSDYSIEITNGFDNYSAVPTEFTKVATRASGTDTGNLANGAMFTTTYAVYISRQQPTDAYIGKVKYTMLHPALEEPPHAIETEPNYIGYYPNTTTNEGAMDKQPVSNTDTTIRLRVPNFSRKNYGFAGWNDKYDYSGNFYGPNETINITAGQYSDDNNGLSLYAVWIESEGFLQNWQGCSSLEIGETTALTDIRDNQTYAVAKLADGNCWTIENLRLNNDTIANSDGALAQGYDSSFGGLANPESGNFVDTTTSNSIYGIDGSASGYAIIGPNAGYRFPRYNNDNITNRTATLSNDDENIYGYGNYYTWAAAIADTSHYENGNHNTTSICPTGWHLPSGQINGEFYNLNYALDDNTETIDYVINDKIRKYPNNFVLSGYYDGSSTVNRGYSGSYWSSTTNSANGSHYLYMFNSRVYPGTISFYKYIGQSVRCIIGN